MADTVVVKKYKMSSKDRIALSKILRKEIRQLKLDRPLYNDAVRALSERYSLRITRGGFNEVMEILNYKWIPIPKQRKRAKPREELNTDMLAKVQPLLKLLADLDGPTLLAALELAQEQKSTPRPRQLKDNWDSMAEKPEPEAVPQLFD